MLLWTWLERAGRVLRLSRTEGLWPGRACLTVRRLTLRPLRLALRLTLRRAERTSLRSLAGGLTLLRTPGRVTGLTSRCRGPEPVRTAWPPLLLRLLVRACVRGPLLLHPRLPTGRAGERRSRLGGRLRRWTVGLLPWGASLRTGPSTGLTRRGRLRRAVLRRDALRWSVLTLRRAVLGCTVLRRRLTLRASRSELQAGCVRVGESRRLLVGAQGAADRGLSEVLGLLVVGHFLNSSIRSQNAA
jgi:hypothetical protein